MIAIIGAVVSKILFVYQFVISAVNLFLGGQKPWVFAANASKFVYVPRTSGQGIGMMRKRRMRRKRRRRRMMGLSMTVTVTMSSRMTSGIWTGGLLTAQMRLGVWSLNTEKKLSVKGGAMPSSSEEPPLKKQRTDDAAEVLPEKTPAETPVAATKKIDLGALFGGRMID